MSNMNGCTIKGKLGRISKKKMVKSHTAYDVISSKTFARNNIGVYKGSVCLRLKDIMTKAEQRHFLKTMMRGNK